MAHAWILWMLAGFAAVYLLAVAALWGLQGRFIYPGAVYTTGVTLAPQGFELVSLRTEDGLTLWALWRAPSRGMPVAVFFHGNGSSAKHAIHAVAPFLAEGYGMLLPEYRGYGGNAGVPSEAGLFADGRAAMRWLDAHGHEAEDVVVIGNSLGSGVATEMALDGARALVLVSPFTDLPAVAGGKLRWLPAARLVRDRYDNLAKIGRVGAPVLVLHGARDGLIPIAQAEALARAARDGRLVRFPSFGHELAWRREAGLAAVRWLDERPRLAEREWAR